MNYITIPNFSRLKPQTLFNRAVKHIGKTQRQSLKNGVCCYGGTGCNAAPFIREDQREAADALGSSSSWAELVQAGMVPQTNKQFISELQSAHDKIGPEYGMGFMQSYDHRMRELAEEHGLNTKALDALGWRRQ